MNKKPPLSLFIIGMPRSGTKLFRTLLNNHPKIFIPEIETLFIPDLLKRYKNKILTSSEIRIIVNELKNSLFFFYYLKKHTFDFNPLYVGNLTVKSFLDLFFNELAEQSNQKVNILGDKSPNYINDIDLLLDYYPDAKFIHLVRDPRDYALSVNKAWNKNLLRAAFKWAQGISKIQDLPIRKKQSILEIKYENLIENPEKTLKEVCDFIAIEYKENMIYLNKSVENLGDARSKKVSKNNSQKYLTELSKQEITRIEELTVEFLNLYGYKHCIANNKNKNVSKSVQNYWKLFDGYHLLKFNLKEHGLKSGLSKILKAVKH